MAEFSLAPQWLKSSGKGALLCGPLRTTCVNCQARQLRQQSIGRAVATPAFVPDGETTHIGLSLTNSRKTRLAGDDSRRAKPLDTGRTAAQQDPWGPRTSTTATAANGAQQSDRSSSNSGSWKPRDPYGPPSRSGGYQSLNHKPLSAREYSARGAYGGRSGESEGGAGPLPSRSLSERESWPATRGLGTRDEGSRSALLGPSGGGAGNGTAKVSCSQRLST